MNWKLILALSLFGLGMAVGTVYFIPSNVEPFCWLAIFLVCAFSIAKQAPGRFFLHGFCVSLVNCIWITAAHVLLYDTYIAKHPDEAAQMADSPLPPRIAMLLVGPIIGILSGLVLGFFSWLAAKLLKR